MTLTSDILLNWNYIINLTKKDGYWWKEDSVLVNSMYPSIFKCFPVIQPVSSKVRHFSTFLLCNVCTASPSGYIDQIESKYDFLAVHRIESDRNEKFGIVPSLLPSQKFHRNSPTIWVIIFNVLNAYFSMVEKWKNLSWIQIWMSSKI